MKKIIKIDKGKPIKSSTSIHYSEDFITKRHFDEFADKICRAISLQVQNPESGSSKQTATQALGGKRIV